MRWRTSNNTRDERGAAAVEFALVMIPLLMIMAGIINFGFVFAQQLALDNAVRAGARAGVVDTGKDPAVVTKDEWDSSAIAKDSLTQDFIVGFPGLSTCEGSDFGDRLAVQGTVTANFMIPWPFPDSVLSQSIDLSSQAEFQCEYE